MKRLMCVIFALTFLLVEAAGAILGQTPKKAIAGANDPQWLKVLLSGKWLHGETDGGIPVLMKVFNSVEKMEETGPIYRTISMWATLRKNGHEEDVQLTFAFIKAVSALDGKPMPQVGIVGSIALTGSNVVNTLYGRLVNNEALSLIEKSPYNNLGCLTMDLTHAPDTEELRKSGIPRLPDMPAWLKSFASGKWFEGKTIIKHEDGVRFASKIRSDGTLEVMPHELLFRMRVLSIKPIEYSTLFNGHWLVRAEFIEGKQSGRLLMDVYNNAWVLNVRGYSDNEHVNAALEPGKTFRLYYYTDGHETFSQHGEHYDHTFQDSSNIIIYSTTDVTLDPVLDKDDMPNDRTSRLFEVGNSWSADGTFTQANRAFPGHVTLVRTVSDSIEGTAQFHSLTLNRDITLTLKGTIRDRAIKIKSYREGRYWSDWEGTLDLEQGLFLGTFRNTGNEGHGSFSFRTGH